METARLNAIAITNHNVFDLDNYNEIKDALNIPVFPGVELNVSNPGGFGHVLLIAPEEAVDTFNANTSTLSSMYRDEKSHLSWQEIAGHYPEISDYIINPHFKKHKPINSQTLEAMKASTGITALEVDNNKKWLRYTSETDLPLVVFSDARPGLKLPDVPDEDSGIRYSYGFTYTECEEVKVSTIKSTLTLKRNVSVFTSNNEFEILPEAIPASMRLNVILGNRSSGKTHTLDRILDTYTPENCIYIRQFDITSDTKKENFEKAIEKSDESFFDNYFAPLQDSFSEYFKIDFGSFEVEVDDYCEALTIYANSPEDDCSKCPIYSEEPFSFEAEDLRLNKDFELIKAVRLLCSDLERK